MISRCARRRLVRLAKKCVEKRNGCENDASGISSCYAKISECWGVKWTHKGGGYMAQTFATHRRMWRKHIAPFCFGLFQHKLKNGHKIYAYIVQIARVASAMSDCGELSGVFQTDIFMDGEEYFKKTYKKLKELLRKYAKLSWPDCHWHNFGLLGSNWVIIDWGSESMQVVA